MMGPRGGSIGWANRTEFIVVLQKSAKLLPFGLRGGLRLRLRPTHRIHKVQLGLYSHEQFLWGRNFQLNKSPDSR